MIPSIEFTVVGESLKVGTSVRVNHTCGEGRTLKVSRPSLDTINAWCFRCNDGGYVSGQLNLATMLDNLAPVITYGESPKPPVNSNTPIQEWPREAKLWLYKSGLTLEDIKEIGAYWSESTKRVVLPLNTVEGVMVGYIARAVYKGHTPKYLSYTPKLECSPVGYGSNKAVVVLTEDALSAYKVASRANVCAWPLLGTSLRSSYLTYLVKWNPHVVLWLDPDKGGDKARARILPTLFSVGLCVTEVHSKTDPKLLCRDDILKLLEDVL